MEGLIGSVSSRGCFGVLMILGVEIIVVTPKQSWLMTSLTIVMHSGISTLQIFGYFSHLFTQISEVSAVFSHLGPKEPLGVKCKKTADTSD